MGNVIVRLRSLSPFGPIVGKELRSTSRRRRTYFLRFGYLGALLLVLLFCHLVKSLDMNGGSVVRRAQQSAEMGSAFFLVFSVFTWFAMALVGPILTSTAINSERLHKTLPVLLMTPINAWQIAAGKLFARLLVALTLIGLSLPVLAVVRLLGGVEITQMFAVVSLCLATVLMAAAVGLFFSTLMARAYSVILLSYALLGFIWAVLPLLLAMVLFGVMDRGGRAAEVFFSRFISLTNPFFATVALAAPEAPPFTILEWYWCALLCLALAALSLMLSAVVLRRMARRENGGSGPRPAPPAALAMPDAPVESEAGPEAQAAVMADAAAPRRQRAGTSSDVSDNPVLWRELRRPLFTRRWQQVAGSVIVLGTLGLIYILMAATRSYPDGTMLGEEDAQIGFAFVFCGLLNVLVCIVSATAIAQEKESDTWTLLLATPLSARQVVWGKLAGLARRMLWPAVLIAGHFVLFTLFGVLSPASLLIVLWMTFSTNVIWMATGLYLSLRLRTVTFAVILNLLGPVLMYLGVLVILGIVGALVDGHNIDTWVEVVGLYSPYVYMGEAVDRFSGEYRARELWLPVFGPASVADFFVMAFIAGGAHLAATALVIRHTVRRFDQIVERAVQR